MTEVVQTIDVGSIYAYRGKLSFSAERLANGDRYLILSGHDPGDLRKVGIRLSLNQSGLKDLKTLVEKAEQAFEELSESEL